MFSPHNVVWLQAKGQYIGNTRKSIEIHSLAIIEKHFWTLNIFLTPRFLAPNFKELDELSAQSFLMDIFTLFPQ